MHGQKKRRKRSIQGSVALDGVNLIWQLTSEPQWLAEGLRGMRISVQVADGHNRELIIEYPFPKKRTSGGLLPQIPQRPKFSPKTVEADVRKALAAGWDPASRGKAFVFKVPEIAN